jgi:hypothetical protein
LALVILSLYQLLGKEVDMPISIMHERTFYFAYGSNMAIERLRMRVTSVELICVATLARYSLKFHKLSKKDGSGKCDAAYSGRSEDCIMGALYSVRTDQLSELDRFEGCGNGYERKTVSVNSLTDKTFNAETYIATNIDHNIRPLDWYKEHVLRGARAISLPRNYIELIESVVADTDSDNNRRVKELQIYN